MINAIDKRELGVMVRHKIFNVCMKTSYAYSIS